MPYIAKDLRPVADFAPRSAGELNYAFTRLIVGYIGTKGLSYQTINDILGALDGAAREFYRRVAAPYENGAIERNSDVYPVYPPKR